MNNNVIGLNICKLRDMVGVSQEELGRNIGVTKSTVSQWELGKAYPKRKNVIKLAGYFNVTIDDIEKIDNIFNKAEKKEDRICKYEDEIRYIPFYPNIYASAGNGCANDNEEYELIHIKDLPLNKKNPSLFCIAASGDSMEPVLKHGSLVVIDANQTNIIDGNMYVFRQDEVLRVKIFSYEKNVIKVISYNKHYNTETYRFDELPELNIIGRVVFHSTKIV